MGKFVDMQLHFNDSVNCLANTSQSDFHTSVFNILMLKSMKLVVHNEKNINFSYGNWQILNRHKKYAYAFNKYTYFVGWNEFSPQYLLIS